jgi:sarcosine oxidase/L-pipecolate oxidase
VRAPPLLSEAHAPLNALPAIDDADYRALLTTWLPQFATRPFTKSQGCWSLATFDSNWILGPHPSSPQSLFLGAGGNGHSFKNLVNLGKYVVQAIEGALEADFKHMTEWRPSRAGNQIVDKKLADIDKVKMIKDGVAQAR